MYNTSKEEYAERRNARAEARAERHDARKKRREDSPERELPYYAGKYSLEVDAWDIPFSVHLEKFPQALTEGKLRESLVRFYACYNVVVHFHSACSAPMPKPPNIARSCAGVLEGRRRRT